ncbi:hypothetical protein ABZ672_16175 [Streptomyces mirabilis]|uniref:hypothetical protein n=1 Tax=Streptomyces mirabilis TaxID=68239 RepID=UPI00340D85E6
MTESHVEAMVKARIARVAAEQERKRLERQEFAAARSAGLARRHAQKLRRQAPTPKEIPMPAALRPVHCPACRRERPARLTGTVTINGTRYEALRCLDSACGLLWLTRPEQPRTAPAAA